MATMMMIEPSPGSRPLEARPLFAVSRHLGTGDQLADRHAVDAQQMTRAVVGLHQHADGPAAVLLGQDAGGRADASLELVADHPGAAADAPFGDRAV